MENKRLLPIEIEDAKLIFKNFRGEKDQFNKTGAKTFGVLLDTEVAVVLEKDGWNVKWFDPKDEGDTPQAWLPCQARFDPFPPHVEAITSVRKVLNEKTIGMIDSADIITVDVIITGSRYNMHGKDGIKAYLKEMYVRLNESRFASKYSDIPEMD